MKLEPPSEAAVPDLKRVSMPTLGPSTSMRSAAESKVLASDAELQARIKAMAPKRKPAQARRLRPEPPAITVDLAGRRIEVAWSFVDDEALDDEPFLSWCPATIEAVSDDENPGWLYLNYDEDASWDDWFNAKRKGSFDPSKPRKAAWRFLAAEDDAEGAASDATMDDAPPETASDGGDDDMDEEDDDVDLGADAG